MRKYDMAFVDLSEIAAVTANEEQLQKTRERMTELGLLTEKGNPSPSQIGLAVQELSAPFFDKLSRRMARRPGWFDSARDTVRKLYENKEYTALFLYVAILYGYLEWQVPERLRLLPAAPEALRVFAGDFAAAMEAYGKEDGETDAGLQTDI